MSVQSAIEWTDATWNPVRGCTKVSPGCKHCYAERFAERFRGVPGHPFEYGFDLRLVPEKLPDPLRWRTPKMIFVNSMSDLFHEGVPDDYIEAVARVMAQANWHTFQILTKRSTRMQDLLRTRLRFAAELRNVWWGVSVEDKQYGLPRIAHLRQSGAAVKFLSIEPLIEDIGAIRLDGIDWMIVGGESGPGARPIDRAMGEIAAEAVPGLRGKVLLQTVGRRSKTLNRTDTRRANLQRVSGSNGGVRPRKNSLRMNLISAIQKTSGGFIPVTALAGD